MPPITSPARMAPRFTPAPLVSAWITGETTMTRQARTIHGSKRRVIPRHPPIGALGFAPQNTCEPIIPIRCTSTMFKIIDFAVACPTPTGPPEAV